MPEQDIPEVSDQALVDLAGNGDISAYGVLYDRYVSQIYRYAYFRVTNQADAEDLTESAFLKTFELIKRDRSKIDHFKGWIFHAAHNLVIDYYRSKRILVTLEDAVELHDPTPLPERAMQDEEEKLLVQTMMRRLDEVSQQVLTCRFINGLDHEETAQIMRIKSGHVRVLQFRALQKLRELLRKEEVL